MHRSVEASTASDDRWSKASRADGPDGRSSPLMPSPSSSQGPAVEFRAMASSLTRFDADRPGDSGGGYGGVVDPFQWQAPRQAFDFNNASDIFGISSSPFSDDVLSKQQLQQQQQQRPRHSPYPAAFLLDDVPYGSFLNGYVVPLLVVVTVVTNLLVCLVLNRPHMRTATNAVLVAIALSDSLTGLWPLPSYVYFYAMGAKSEYVPYRWCYAYFCLTDYLPTVFHTTSVWLTLLLAAQRYVCVCRGDLPSAGTARRRSVVIKIIVCIYVAAMASQTSRFVEFKFKAVNVTSHVDETQYVIGCQYTVTSFIAEHEQAYFNILYWFRVIFIHLIPCSALVVLTMLLVCTMRQAQRRKRHLLDTATAALSVSAAAARPSDKGPATAGQQASSWTAADIPRRISGGCGRRRRLAEGNNTTLMLVTVVIVFLAVELPQTVTLILIIVQHTFSLSIIPLEAGGVASLVINLVILFSYPTNFFIYCAMSRLFRTTFRGIVCCGRPASGADETGGRCSATTTMMQQHHHHNHGGGPVGGRSTAGDRRRSPPCASAGPDGYLPLTELARANVEFGRGVEAECQTPSDTQM